MQFNFDILIEIFASWFATRYSFLKLFQQISENVVLLNFSGIYIFDVEYHSYLIYGLYCTNND